MNIQAPLHFRALLMVLLLGAQWCGASLVFSRLAVGEQLILAEQNSAVNPAHSDASIGTDNNFSPSPAMVRFNGKTLVGLEDALTLFQEVEANADSPFDLPIETASGSNDTFFAGSTALSGQSLFLQHTRLQI